MNAWIILLISLCIFHSGITLAKHGEPRTPFNWWCNLLDNAIVWFILYKAGLFS